MTCLNTPMTQRYWCLSTLISVLILNFFEFNHVKAWAAINGLTFNLNKTKEIVFRRPMAHSFHLPPVIDNIQQLNCSKLLGVLFQPNLKMDFRVHVMIMILTTLFYYVYTHFRQVHVYRVLPLPYIVTFTALRQWLVPAVADEPTYVVPFMSIV